MIGRDNWNTLEAENDSFCYATQVIRVLSYDIGHSSWIQFKRADRKTKRPRERKRDREKERERKRER